VLLGLGCLGNYFGLPLFFGADFIFGSIAGFIVLHFFGLGWGLLAALVINSFTYFLWGHLYAFTRSRQDLCSPILNFKI